MTVWRSLVGQQTVVDELAAVAAAGERALRGDPTSGMTHAWLFTGPPGSGRSTAAIAFAAALQCELAGCGICESCHLVEIGTHPDVRVVRPSLVSFGVDDTRDLVRRAALAPSGRRWQVMVVEDADRLTDQAVNALLKAVEEPAPHTVWLLCAPTTEDLLPTLRSRCRHVRLRTPSTEAIVAVLVDRDGIDPAVAASAARASQGYVGRARWLATDPDARRRRSDVLAIPASLTGLDACLDAATTLGAAAEEDARAATESVSEVETEQMRRALGFGTVGKAPRGAEGAMRDLEGRQDKRAKRQQRDSLDRALLELLAFYRDVLARQLGGQTTMTDGAAAIAVAALAGSTEPAATLRRIDAILACREALESNVSKTLALEAMTFALRTG
ncbi:MAG: DNA polymerase III subunit delta' [Actinomycetota bacterium]|nr:DNA polymerase III subunit delta' [Actinomycetota bacterium]